MTTSGSPVIKSPTWPRSGISGIGLSGNQRLLLSSIHIHSAKHISFFCVASDHSTGVPLKAMFLAQISQKTSKRRVTISDGNYFFQIVYFWIDEMIFVYTTSFISIMSARSVDTDIYKSVLELLWRYREPLVPPVTMELAFNYYSWLSVLVLLIHNFILFPCTNFIAFIMQIWNYLSPF